MERELGAKANQTLRSLQDEMRQTRVAFRSAGRNVELSPMTDTQTTPFDITEADLGRHVRRKSTGQIGIVSRDAGNGWLHPWVVYEWKGYRDDLEYVTVTPDGSAQTSKPLTANTRQDLADSLRLIADEIEREHPSVDHWGGHHGRPGSYRVTLSDATMQDEL